jgi:hypothetical protein
MPVIRFVFSIFSFNQCALDIGQDEGNESAPFDVRNSLRSALLNQGKSLLGYSQTKSIDLESDPNKKMPLEG